MSMIFLHHRDDPSPVLVLKAQLNDILHYLDTTEPGPLRAQVDVALRRIFQEWDIINEKEASDATSTIREGWAQ